MSKSRNTQQSNLVTSDEQGGNNPYVVLANYEESIRTQSDTDFLPNFFNTSTTDNNLDNISVSGDSTMAEVTTKASYEDTDKTKAKLIELMEQTQANCMTPTDEFTYTSNC